MGGGKRCRCYGALTLCSNVRSIVAERIGTDRAGDVLEGLLAKVSELERDLAANLFVSGRRDADPAGFGYALEPCRNINAITENVIALDQDVPEVDPDPVQHTPV